MVWLSCVLRGARWTPGRQWIGKYRRARKETVSRRRSARERAAAAEQVSAMLSSPYLSQSEEMGHASLRRAQYVPRYQADREARWMRRERRAFPQLSRSN